ncbi:sensor histidine kinase [Methyloceanibacter caenitepidi]|uniref:histidine kinase n=1 Tax=Methyloceanibacter caenitepidi TaxID=1384459 RepID=A0A0A8K0L2_9HYPH|nr:sensor histidine kinase [Methyloceanibacter caenitepidi]BAQ16047.1 sensor histidine kinase ChvG [Methyloceanibacter caenitepidi]
MTAEAERSWQQDSGTWRARAMRAGRAVLYWVRRATRWLGQHRPFRHGFSSLTRRIVVLNLIGLAILVSGILYLNDLRAALIGAEVQSLQTQGEIIARAIAASAGVDAGESEVDPETILEREMGDAAFAESGALPNALGFTIDPERAAPILRPLVKPTGSRARIYDRDGALILDSDTFYSRGEVLRYDLPPPETSEPDALTTFWNAVANQFQPLDLPVYTEIGTVNGKAYPEVEAALTGTSVPIVRKNEKGEIVVSVAVPVERMRSVLGVLLFSTRGGDIDKVVAAERWRIFRVALFAAAVTVVLSLILANTIAGPMQRLAVAAERVRHSVKARAEIPDFTDRSDEIGHLSGALRDMTAALYNRIDAIESFAADVAHELKNPLTSLRSATETLPVVRDQESRMRLMEIIQHDVRRLDRLISDISDASRLDAELAREDAGPVDLDDLLRATVSLYNDIHLDDLPEVSLEIDHAPGSYPYRVIGHDSRLHQVMVNLIENAISFSPPRGRVIITARRRGTNIEILIEDEGPGIPPENLERIFERFYTDRPHETFGQNSGLGLNISRQIIAAHGGKLYAENRPPPGGDTGASGAKRSGGARFVIRLKAA